MTQTWVSSFHRAGSIDTPLALVTLSPLTTANQNVLYNFGFIASGGTPPYVWSILSQTGTNPAASFIGNTLVFTPTVAETDLFTVQVQDRTGVKIQGVFSLTVQPQPVATLPTFSPVAGGYSSTQFVTISCATPGSTIYFTKDGSTPTFPITGTTQQFTGPVIVNVSETLQAIGTAPGFANSAVASGAYSISSPLTITTSSPLPGATQNNFYTLTFVVTGGLTPYVWSLQSGSLNTGLTLSAAGILSGIPQNPETDSFVVKVTDNANNFITKTFSLTTALSIPAGALALGYTQPIYFFRPTSADVSFAGGSASSKLTAGLFTSPIPPFTTAHVSDDNSTGVTRLALNQLGDGVNIDIMGQQRGSIAGALPYLSPPFYLEQNVQMSNNNNFADQWPAVWIMPSEHDLHQSDNLPGQPVGYEVWMELDTMEGSFGTGPTSSVINWFGKFSNAVTFNAPPTGTSGVVASWPFLSGPYLTTFSDNQQRTVTYAQGTNTTATWTGALTGAPTVNATSTYGHQTFNNGGQVTLDMTVPHTFGTSYDSVGNNVQNWIDNVATFAKSTAAFPTAIENYHYYPLVSAKSHTSGAGGAPYALYVNYIAAWGPPGGGGAIPVLTFPNINTTTGLQTVHAAVFSGGAANLTAGTHSSGAVAWANRVDVSAGFTTDFTFVLPGPSAPGPVGGWGMFFYVANPTAIVNGSPTPPPQAAMSASANGCGYASFGNTQFPIGNSIGVKFDCSSFNISNGVYSAGNLSGTGLFIDGGPDMNAPQSSLCPQVDLLSACGIQLGSNNLVHANIVYDGTLLVMLLTDTVTGQTGRFTWPVNLTAITGSSSCYVGLTQGTPSTNSICSIKSWSFSTGFNSRLGTPVISPAAGQYAASQSVSISAAPGATIYYTTDGSTPTTLSNVYSAPFNVAQNTLVQAVAVQSNFTDSLVAQNNYLVQAAATPVINFPSGFASGNAAGLINLVGARTRFSGSNLILNDTTFGSEIGNAWYRVPITITTFDITFGLSLSSVGANGVCFILQNFPQTDTGTNFNLTLGGPPNTGTVQVTGGPFMQSMNGVDLSYTGMFASLAVVYDYFNGSGNLTGLYQNGARPTGSGIDMTGSGVNLHSAGVITTRLQYDGTNLVQTVTQGPNVFSHTYTPLNIPSIVGANKAYAGFGCSAGGATANVSLTKWTA